MTLHRRCSQPKLMQGIRPVADELPILEDRSSIQIALAQILDGLGSAQLDPRRAGLFLYALQIATQNVDRKHDIVSKESVHFVTRTAAGDELGPEAGFCDIPDDCDACDERHTCEDYESEDGDDDEDAVDEGYDEDQD